MTPQPGTDKPAGVANDDLHEVSTTAVVPDPHHRPVHDPLQLQPFQQRCIQRMADAARVRCCRS